MDSIDIHDVTDIKTSTKKKEGHTWTNVVIEIEPSLTDKKREFEIIIHHKDVEQSFKELLELVDSEFDE